MYMVECHYENDSYLLWSFLGTLYPREKHVSGVRSLSGVGLGSTHWTCSVVRGGSTFKF